ncbi:MAG: hypothetical protein AB8H79_10785 [Myxococcota bacterium]
MPTWTRPHFQTSNKLADVAIVVYTSLGLDGLSASVSRHGVPDDTARFPFRLDHYTRTDSPLLFTELKDDSLLSLAKDEGLNIDVIKRVEHQILLRLKLPDPKDCNHLRVGWGLVRAICDATTVHGVLDLHAQRWWTLERLRDTAPDGEMEIRNEVSTALLPSNHPTFARVRHSRGLRKFARPDLVLPNLTLPQALEADEVLYSLARYMAKGANLTPGQPIVVGGFRGTAEPYVANVNAPMIALNNRALVVMPEGRTQL